MTVFTVAVIYLWVIFLFVWAFSAIFVRGEKTRIGLRWFVTRGVVIAAVIAFFNLQILVQYPSSAAPALSPFINTLGVLLCALGIGFAIWARMHIGEHWALPMTENDDPELITSGPYQYVRHPIYTGVLVAILGSALVSGAVWISMFFVFLIYFLYASIQEEKVMETKFPEEYKKYKQHTKMLIPVVF